MFIFTIPYQSAQPTFALCIIDQWIQWKHWQDVTLGQAKSCELWDIMVAEAETSKRNEKGAATCNRHPTTWSKAAK